MEDDSTIKRVGIAKLNGTNYRTWAAIAKAVIEAKDAWEAIEPSVPKAETPVEATDDGIARSDRTESKTPPTDRVRDAKARTVIMGYCGPEALSRILHLQTAREQWKALERAYLPLGRQQLSTALKRYYGFTPKPNASVNSMVTELRESQMDIFSIDPLQKPTDESMTVVLFNALRSANPAYGPITLQLELQDIYQFDVIVGHLEESERRLAAMATVPEAALRTSEKKHKGKEKGKGQVQCWHCEKKGHVRTKCQSWLTETDEGRKYSKDHPESARAKTGPLPTPGAKNSTPTEKAQAVSESTVDVCWEAREGLQRADSWIVDSACTRHMTPNREAFFEYSIVKSRMVEIANGALMPGIGLGKVKLPVIVDGHTRSVVLTDVLHVPQIKGNLISVARLQDKGMVTETTISPARKALIISYQGRKVGVASREGDSFVLDMPADRAFPVGEAMGQQRRSVTDAYTRWHRRFGHIGPQIVGKLHTVVDDLGQEVKPTDGLHACEVCALTKKTRVINRVAPERSTQPLARVFSDFWGPYRVPAITGERYMLTFTDDYTRKAWVVLTSDRASLPFEFARWKALVERQSGRQLIAVRSDNASEYKALGGTALADAGITLELTTPYTPWQNGPSERLNRALATMARSMLLDAKLPQRFWGFAVLAACYLRNRMPIGPEGKCPEEAFTGRKPSTRHLRMFGCIAYADIPSVNRDKLEPTARKTILVGYMPTSKQYRLFDPVTKSIFASTGPRFEEDQFWDWTEEPEEEGEDTDILDLMEPVDLDPSELISQFTDRRSPDSPVTDHRSPEPRDRSSVPGGEEPQARPQEAEEDVVPEQQVAMDDEAEVSSVDEHIGVAAPAGGHNSPQEGQTAQGREPSPPVRRSGREKRQTRFFDEAFAATDKPKIPLSYKEAVSDRVYAQQWKDAIEDELVKLQALNTWEVMDLPDGRRPVGHKWVFTVKYTPTGLIDRFKARLVAQGFSQVQGIDFEETYSPTVRLESLRTLLTVGASLDYEIHQTDVVSAYPRSILHAEVYMRIPEGIQAPPGKCLRVLKSLYGLKQSGREWYIEAAKGLAELGLEPTFADACVFIRKDRSLIVGLHVDDMLILAKDITVIREFKRAIAQRWEIKDLGEVKKILGLEVTRNRSTRSIRIAQVAFTDEIVAEYGLTDARVSSTPSGSPDLLEPVSARDDGKPADADRYRRLIGQLMYLMRGSRPDVCFVVTRLSRYVAQPAERHWKCALQVVRYLKGTREFGTTYSGSHTGQKLEGYVDSDYAGDRTDRKSTYGSVFMLYGGPIAWTSKKQASVSTSTTEAEYVALCQGSKEAMWLRKLLQETGFPQLLGESLGVQMYSDNQGCIALAENPESHSRSKHIDVQYHYTRQLVELGTIKLDYCPTKDMLADILTKPLGFRAFMECARKLVGP